MQPSRATKCYQSETARIASALDRHHADRLFHRGIHHANHSRRKLLERQIRSLLGQPLLCHPTRALEIQCELAAQKFRRLQAAEKKIGIGYGWLLSSAIANRTRISAGGLRADAQNPSGIEPRQ